MREVKTTTLWLRLFRPIIHLFIIVVIFYCLYKVRQFTDLIPGVQLKMPVFNFRETMIYAMIAAVAFVTVGMIKHMYELYKPIQRYIQNLGVVWIYWLIFITFLAYFGQGFLFVFGISRFIIILGAVLSFFVLFFFDMFWKRLEYAWSDDENHKILIIGSNAMESIKAVEKIRKRFSYPTEYISVSDLGDDVDLGEYFMVVAVGSFKKDILQAIFERIRFATTRFYHISEGFFLEDVVYTSENIDDIVMFEYKHSRLDGRSDVFKRFFDLIAGLVLTIIFSPIMLAVIIAIRLDSKGSAIYVQKRVGKGGKLFTFLKFRSMYTHLSTGDGYGGKEADDLYKNLIKTSNMRDNILPKIENDPRVTRVGKFLRKTSLDELPQLLCVLWGTMSLVGPRPHLLNEVEKYATRQKRLFSVNPGITGYAQVFGRDNLDFEDEAKLDLYYIQHWSIFLDWYIVFATLGVVFKGR